MFKFTYGAQSHVGLVRDNNEDSGFAGPYLQLVADGVGGAAAGEIASATTAYVVSAMTAAGTNVDLLELLRSAVRESARQLRQGVTEDQGRAGMATTLTAVAIQGTRFALAHVGDSRAYLWRDGQLTQLTTDHSFVQALIDEGRLTREEAAVHPYRSAVLRSIDGEHEPEPDVAWLELQLHDRLLICSDGLSDLVPASRIGELLSVEDPDLASGALVEAALERGGKDNVTCLVADVDDGPALCADGRLLGALQNPYLIVDPAAVRLEQTA
jgi:protein phosphatase